jgi:hypothetical protein
MSVKRRKYQGLAYTRLVTTVVGKIDNKILIMIMAIDVDPRMMSKNN